MAGAGRKRPSSWLKTGAVNPCVGGAFGCRKPLRRIWFGITSRRWPTGIASGNRSGLDRIRTGDLRHVKAMS